MKERIPTSDIPDGLHMPSPARTIRGLSVQGIEKSGSGLHFVTRDEDPIIVRNSEMPPSSMAAWEFLDSYAANIFQPAMAQKLFGPWKTPQVVHLLQKGGRARVRRSKSGNMTAYSKFSGLDTIRLEKQIGLEGLFMKYNFVDRKHGPQEQRWGESNAYHMLKDLMVAIPHLDGGERIMESVENYWAEFAKLNARVIERRDLLTARELRRGDMDNDSRFRASLLLVETGHAIAEKLARIYRREIATGATTLWQDRPVADVLLLLIHLFQAAAQQKVMWFLGISHGHLHVFNIVSREAPPDLSSSVASPLITTIIDFDDAQTNPEMLATNNELYAMVDSEKLKTDIADPATSQRMKLQLLHYLPIDQWDATSFDLISKADAGTRWDLLHLAALRASVDIPGQEPYAHLADLIYAEEQHRWSDWFPAFSNTIAMVRARPDSFAVASSPLRQVSIYFQTGNLPFDKTGAEIQERTLMLSAICLREASLHSLRLGTRDFSANEINYVIDQCEQGGQVGDCGIEFFKRIMRFVAKDTFVKRSGGEEVVLMRMASLIFSSPYFDSFGRELFVHDLAAGRHLGSIIQNMDLSSAGKDKGLLIYKNLRMALSRLPAAQRKWAKRALDMKAQSAFGKLAVLRRKLLP